MKLKEEYIEKHKSLFWYTPQSEIQNISDELLLETILNYGKMQDVKELFSIWGIDYLSEVFWGMKERKINNFYPEIYNFFSLIFTRYAHRDIKGKL